MRIERVDAYAFGPFVGRTLELASGMTVVHGPNEAGKSSWHAALYAGLCGMRRRPGRNNEDREFAERHRPWDDERWEVGVSIRLSDGRGVELRHNLANLTDCRASDSDTGRDVSAEIMHENTPDGALYLGLTRRSLLPTICVRQTELLAVLDNSQLLQEHLQRAASTGGTDEPAERAIKRLRDYHSTRVGLERQNSTRPLMAAIRWVSRAEQDLAAAVEQHAAYLDLVARRDRLADAARAARDRRAAVVAAAAHARVAAMEGRVERARRLAAEFDGTPPPAPAGEDRVGAIVSAALAAYTNRPEEAAPLGGHTAAELAEQLEALPPAPEGDTEFAPAVAAARRAWERTATAVELHAQPRPAAVRDAPDVGRTPAELRRMADDLDLPDPEIPDGGDGAPRGRRPAVAALVAAGVLTVAAAGLLAAGQLVAGSLLLAAAATTGATGVLLGRGGSAAVARRETARVLHEQTAARRERARADADQLGLEADPGALRRLAVALESSERAAADAADWQERATALAAAVEEAAATLRKLLSDRGVAGGDLAALLERYEQDCRQRAEQARQAARRPELQEALAVRRAAEEAAADVRRRRADVEAGLREAAVAASVEADDAEGLAAALRTWQSERAAALDAAHQARERWAGLQELLDGRDLAEWEATLERQRAQLPQAPEGVEVALEDDLDAQLHRVEQKAEAAQAAAKIAEGEVRTVEQSLPSVAEAEEELARARAEEERVRRLSDTLTRTRAFLETARDRVYRDVAPQLSAAVQRALPAVTAGRYSEARVDPETLLVRVRNPGGDWRPATRLSRGTSEQIYLLLRLAMAEHLVTTGEPAPLLLDDVTTQSDPERSRAVLDLLHAVSAERQVVVFSQEDIVLEWAREQLAEPRDRLEVLDAVPV